MVDTLKQNKNFNDKKYDFKPKEWGPPPNIFSILIYFLVFTLLIAVAIFNVIAMINYSKALEIDILNKPPKCDYSDVKDLPHGIHQFNSKDSTDSLMLNGIHYKLSTTPTYYLNVCKQICGGSLNSQGECNTVGNIKQFNICTSLLEPKSTCSSSELPIAIKSTKETSGKIENVIYYASGIIRG